MIDGSNLLVPHHWKYANKNDSADFYKCDMVAITINYNLHQYNSVSRAIISECKYKFALW